MRFIAPIYGKRGLPHLEKNHSPIYDIMNVWYLWYPLMVNVNDLKIIGS